MSQPRIIGQAVGGALFVDLSRFSRYVVSDGMALLTADEAGVHVNLRPDWIQRLALADFRIMSFRPKIRHDMWYAPWGEISIARRDRNSDSIFMRNGAGERVRFSASIPCEMRGFTDELLNRGVPIEWVKTTFWDVYRRRRHWDAAT